jgi:hypothetical protein
VNPGQQVAIVDEAGRTLHAEAGWVLRRTPGQGLHLGTTAADGLQQLRQLLNQGSRFKPDWATVPLRLEDQAAAPAMTLSDPGGELLSSRLGAPFAIERFLALAPAMAQTLTELHALG